MPQVIWIYFTWHCTVFFISKRLYLRCVNSGWKICTKWKRWSTVIIHAGNGFSELLLGRVQSVLEAVVDYIETTTQALEENRKFNVNLKCVMDLAASPYAIQVRAIKVSNEDFTHYTIPAYHCKAYNHICMSLVHHDVPRSMQIQMLKPTNSQPSAWVSNSK